jgi:hypothetical protein
MLPLNDADFFDFIFNYFKAEYSPIRSFWGTATAEPRQPRRWISMGHELSPLNFRPANAQAQKDLESLDYWVRQKNLDAGFVRGIVIRYAKYELHERLEKKLYESCRLDLMVRKALKEKHLIDVLWPSPAPRNTKPDLLQQGVKVRQWYGDMFSKYFRLLHSVDDFTLRPEVDAKIKSSGTLMLVPFVDHLIFGAVDPIMPIIARGAGYANSAAWKQKDKGGSFGEPDRFEIRFDAPAEMEDTHTRSVVRQCQCLKCGSKRDVTVVISVDPSPGPPGPQTAGKPNTSAPRRQGSKAAQRYSPGYSMPGINDNAPRQPAQAQELPAENRSASPLQTKQCSRCTFLNHPELTSCEICQAELPDKLVAKPPSPKGTSKAKSKSSHSHSASLPPPASVDSKPEKPTDATRPAAPNRHSLSSTLFSIFPFNQEQQSEHHAKLPPTQPTEFDEAAQSTAKEERVESSASKAKEKYQPRPSKATPTTETNISPPNLIDAQPEPLSQHERSLTPPLSQPPEMAMMPLTPSPTSQTPRHLPGMPQNLMDDFVSVSPSFQRDDDEDAGWGEMSKEEANKDEDSDSDEDEEDARRREMIDLDLVAREEMGVWGDREDNN